jgi:phenylacetate-coenzyme A ligase PaaK-like adenylate-forming protein
MTAREEQSVDRSFDVFRAGFQAALSAAFADHLGRLDWDRTRIEAVQRDRLRTLLTVAKERSPFHARRLAHIDPATFELGDLLRLPVMSKVEMMAAFDDVTTDRRLTRAVAEETIGATATVPRPIDGELLLLASGGSSGTRGLFAFDVAAFAEYAASILRPAMARRAAAGDSPAASGPLVIVAAASAIHATGAAPPLLAGTPLAFKSVPVTLPLDQIVVRLNHLRPAVLYGYPSMLALLAGEQRAGRLHISPRSVSANSETLYETHRRAIRDAFGVPLADTYGSSEGLVGASAPDEHTMTFASDCCITELVDENDAPIPPGTTSAAVLVTNLFNTVQPLIRHRIEDRLTQRAPAGNGHLRADVEGRAPVVFDYGDVAIHPLVIGTSLTRRPHIVDFQVRQTDRGVIVDLITTGSVDITELTTELTATLADAGRTDPTVDVRVVPALRRDSRTGKLAQFVPAPARSRGPVTV